MPIWERVWRSSSAAQRALLVSLVCATLCSASCSRRRAPEPARAAQVVAQPAAPEAPARAPEPAAPAPWPPPSANPTPQPAADEAPAEEKKKRDFSAEFTTAIGNVSSCVQARPAENSATISISVIGHVMPSGAVGRGEVIGGSLQPDEIACVRMRAESVHFAPPIENAPFAVNASLTVTPRIAAAAKKPETPPQQDQIGMIVTQAPSGEGISPGVVPTPTPGVVPTPTPGEVPTPDPPAEVLPIPEPVAPQQ